ncbi:MAG: glycosyltransferase [Thermodesulforhabdaceae bacterium]
MIYAEDNPSGVAEADLVVAIPTFNEAANIASITQKIDAGLVKHYPDAKGVIIVCDNHSVDGTRETFLEVETKNPKIYISSAPGERGKGTNLRNLFEKLLDLKPKAVAIFEADIRNIQPDWIYYFIEPIRKGAGYVVPIYVLHKYESTLSSIVVYPLLRCLFGRRVRQSTAGDYAFAGGLIEYFAKALNWSDLVSQKGIDIWMLVNALYLRQPVCQTIIGSPKLHRMKDPHAQINKAFVQLVGTLLDLMTPYQDFWMRVKWSKPTILFNAELQEAEVPMPVDVNIGRLFEMFSGGLDTYRDVLSQVLSSAEMHKLDEIRSMGIQHFNFPSHTWATILFDMAVAYRDASPDLRMSFLEALLPLYYGKVASYVRRTERMSIQQAEEVVENECMAFEENKSYLINRWKVA